MTLKACAYAAALTLGVVQTSAAGGPVPLTASELDRVTAGQVEIAELRPPVTIFPDGTMVPGSGPGGPLGEMPVPAPDNTPGLVVGGPVSDVSLSLGLFVLVGPFGPFAPLGPGLGGLPFFAGTSSDDMSMSAASSSGFNP